MTTRALLFVGATSLVALVLPQMALFFEWQWYRWDHWSYLAVVFYVAPAAFCGGLGMSRLERGL